MQPERRVLLPQHRKIEPRRLQKIKNKPSRLESFASVWDAIVDTREEAAYLHMRSDLMGTITVLIEASGWTQAKAAHQ